MPWEREWIDDLLRDTVRVQTFSTVSDYGTPSWGSSSDAVTYRARVDWQEHKVVGADGQEAVARMTIYLGQTSSGGAVPSMTSKDRVIMSHSSASSELPRVLTVDRWIDPESTTHYFLGIHCA